MFKKLMVMAASCAALAVVGIAAWLFVGASPGTVDAHQLLQTASEKQTVVETYKVVTSSSHIGEFDGAPGVYEGMATAFVVTGQGVYVVTETTGGYDEYLMLSDKRYHRPSATGPWQEVHDSSLGYVLPSMDSGKHAHLIGTLVDPQVEGDETYKGTETTKIGAWRDMERQVNAIWGNIDELDDDVRAGIDPHRDQMLAGQERFSAWVGKENGLIYGYTNVGAYPAHDGLPAYQTTETVVFSDFNGPFEIPNPAESGTRACLQTITKAATLRFAALPDSSRPSSHTGWRCGGTASAG